MQVATHPMLQYYNIMLLSILIFKMLVMFVQF